MPGAIGIAALNRPAQRPLVRQSLLQMREQGKNDPLSYIEID